MKIIWTHSVTQSYAKSFLGYVVLDTFNNVSRDEDNILDQIYTLKNYSHMIAWRCTKLAVKWN